MALRQIFRVAILTCLLINCNNNGTGPQYFDVQLTADDVGVTEAWLRLQIAPSVHHNALRLTLDGSSVLTAQYSGLDTVVLVNSLLPKHSYTFKAYTLSDSVTKDSSNAFTVATMDTTSHNITWQIDTLGNGASSSLYDVSVINDTLAYAVGEIYLKDSTGQLNDPPYNAARWNGKRWNLMRILIKDFGDIAGYFPLRAVFGFSRDFVWFVSDANLIRSDGHTFTSKAFFATSLPFNGQVLKMWGPNYSNLFCVGRSGSIYSYTDNSNSWQELESGTTTDIDDIWGAFDKNNHLNILCVVSNLYNSGESKLLNIDSIGNLESLSWNPPHRINSVWFTTLNRIFVGGGGLYVVQKNGNWQEITDLPPYFSTRVRGTAVNDVFVVGAFGLCGHFNGLSWKSYPEVALPNGSYEGLSITSNMVVAVGYTGAKAVVLHGYRK